MVALIPDNPYGFTMSKAQNNLDSLSATAIAQSNAAWVRPQINWSAMETVDNGNRGSTLGAVSWTFMDNAVATATAAGLRICLPIQNPPNWHCTQCGNNQNTQIPNALDFLAFAEAAVLRYNGNNGHGLIQAIHMNEDWDAFSAGWPLGTGNSYNPTYACRQFTPLQSILPTLYAYVQANAPGMLVGAPSLLGKRTDATHIQTLVQQLPLASLDFVDIHAYNCSFDPALPNGNNLDPSFPTRFAAIKAGLVAAGYPNKDIWMTEFGWKDGQGATPDSCDISTTLVSTYLQRAIAQAKSYGISHYFIYTIGDNENDSLTVNDNLPKASYTTMQTFFALPTGGNPPPPPPPDVGNGLNDLGIVRYGYNEVSQGIPIGGLTRQKILSMAPRKPVGIWARLKADIADVVQWVEERIP